MNNDKELREALPDGEEIKFMRIPPGTFLMGSPDSEADAYPNEKPQHEVKITKGFYLGKYVVTQGQWESMVGTQPWSGKEGFWEEGSDHPAVWVSWEDVQEFCETLNATSGRELYRLSTEAEWEYACRAGTNSRWSFGDDESKLGNYAWNRKNAWDVDEKYAHPVGLKCANPWGLHEMHGNVLEWCRDWFGKIPLGDGLQIDPPGLSQEQARRQHPEGRSNRVLRGADFATPVPDTRSANRGGAPSDRYDDVGFRLLRTSE